MNTEQKDMNNSRKVRALVDTYAIDLEVDLKERIENLIVFIRN